MKHFKMGAIVIGVIILACIIVSALSVAIPVIIAMLKFIGPFVAGVAILVGLVWLIGFIVNKSKGIKLPRRTK